MIADKQNKFGMWRIGDFSIVRERGSWIAHFVDEYEPDKTLCKKKISEDFITSPTMILTTCQRCLDRLAIMKCK